MPLYICSLPNPGEPGAPHECIADDPHVIEAFARREDKPGRGVYDCVSPLKPGARRRSLETIGEIVALHVDIDGKDLAEDFAVRGMARPRFAAAAHEVRNSGRGRHVVCTLKESVNAADEDGGAGKRQTAPAAHRLPVRATWRLRTTAALLRRPGTHNSKGGAWAECTRRSSITPGTIPATLPIF